MKLRDYEKTEPSVKISQTSLPDSSDLGPKEKDGFRKFDKLELERVDCAGLDLSMYDPEHIRFDTLTRWPTDPQKWPKDFSPEVVLETHKNPGLGVRSLHAKGITGKGRCIAIIDQIMGAHSEYNNQLKLYEEVGDLGLWKGAPAAYHGSMVSSLAVGKTCGVAPEADLYFYGVSLFTPESTEEKQEIDYQFKAAALERIIEKNKELKTQGKQIDVVSVSRGFNPPDKNFDLWEKALNHAKEEGLFVNSTSIRFEYGLRDHGIGCRMNGDPDNPNDYQESTWGNRWGDLKEVLLSPMDHRTCAGFLGPDHYIHSPSGGWSQIKPYESALFLLARQVDPTVTPEQFWAQGLKTGTYSEKCGGVIINPPALIDAIQHHREQQITANLQLFRFKGRS